MADAHNFTAADGTRLAWHEMGQGRPVVLLHGYISDAATNWVKYGHAATIAAKGFRIIMSDLRGHGASDRPHRADAYPPDILADDGLALIAHLGLTDFDLGGYSLGGRTVVRMLARGCQPRRAIVAGMGLSGVVDTGRRRTHFAEIFERFGTHPQGSNGWFVEAFMKTTGADPVAMRRLLDSFIDTTLGELAALDTPTLILCGSEDDDNGSARDLADAMPGARYQAVPGTHMSAVAKPELGRAMADYLAA